MHRLAVVLVAVLLASVARGQKIGEVPRVEPSGKAEVGTVLEWSTPQGQEYWYRLPKKSRGKPALVLMLHGTGLNHGWSFWNYPIGTGEFRGGDIVVSPDGLSPGNGDTFNFNQNKADAEQIVDLIAFFRSRFEIGNVYLYGHSQGAFFSYWFAGEHPELVDGIVAHAGNVLGNVRHPKLAKEKVAIGILHARSDQVVPVICAEETLKVYENEGYARLKCWIVEDIRDEAGHWPLPPHVTEMFEWLDSVCTNSAGQATDVAANALFGEEPDLAVAVRAAGEARGLLKREKGDDKEAIAKRLDLVEKALDATADVVWAHLDAALAENEGGKQPGAYAADVRWARRAFGDLPFFRTLAKPLDSLAKKHDKLFAKLAKSKDTEGKKYAKALLKALEQGWLGIAWDEVHARETTRVGAGWKPTDDLADGLASLAASHGAEPSEAIRKAAKEALAAFAQDHPEIRPE